MTISLSRLCDAWKKVYDQYTKELMDIKNNIKCNFEFDSLKIDENYVGFYVNGNVAPKVQCRIEPEFEIIESCIDALIEKDTQESIKSFYKKYKDIIRPISIFLNIKLSKHEKFVLLGSLARGADGLILIARKDWVYAGYLNWVCASGEVIYEFNSSAGDILKQKILNKKIRVNKFPEIIKNAIA